MFHLFGAPVIWCPWQDCFTQILSAAVSVSLKKPECFPCVSLWAVGISAENKFWGEHPVSPNLKYFSLPLQKNLQPKLRNPEVSPARSLNSDELFRWFLSQKNWNDRGSFLPGASHTLRKALPTSLQAQNPIPAVYQLCPARHKHLRTLHCLGRQLKQAGTHQW